MPHASRRHVRLADRAPCQHCGRFARSHCPPALSVPEGVHCLPGSPHRPTGRPFGSPRFPKAGVHTKSTFPLFSSPSCAREAMSRTWAGRISVRVLCVQCDVRAHSSVRQLLIGAAAHGLALRTRRHVAAHCNMVRGVEACPSRCNLRCRQRPTLRARSSSTRFRSAARYRPRPVVRRRWLRFLLYRFMRAGGRESAAMDFARPRGARLAGNQGTARRSTVLTYSTMRPPSRSEYRTTASLRQGHRARGLAAWVTNG